MRKNFLLRVSEGAVESGGFERDDEFCIISQVYFGFHEDYIKSIFGLGAEREECGDTSMGMILLACSAGP